MGLSMTFGGQLLLVASQRSPNMPRIDTKTVADRALQS